MSISESTVFLVVDDIDHMRKAIVSQLYAMGLRHFVEARNGADALETLKHKKIDVILSDQDMPVMSGLNLLKAVRKEKNIAHLPFLLVTSVVNKDYVLEAVNCGVSSIIIKPYTFKSLSEHIEKAIKTPVKIVDSNAKKIVAQPDKPTKAQSTERLTILVVDDTPDNLHLLSSLFKDSYRVQVAPNGELALKICTSDNPPDLVLLDVMMPGMTGFEVAEKMREHPNSEHIPIIFVTAMNDEDARAKGLNLGAIDFVSKPVDVDVLKMRVDNFMNYAQLHKQLQSDYDTIIENALLHDEIHNLMQHDAKTPLNNLINLVQLISSDTSLIDKHRSQLQLIEEMALQSINTINSSSELYRIENQTFELNAKPVDIQKTLRRLIDIARQTYHLRHLTVTFETDSSRLEEEVPNVLGDASLCYSLFHNLINLACDGAREKSTVNITLNDDNNPVKVIISSKNKLPITNAFSFFEKYKNGNELNVAYSAKLLTEAQHGKIYFELNREENLSVITVELPKVSLDTDKDSNETYEEDWDNL